LFKRFIVSYLILNWGKTFLSARAEGEKKNKESFSELLYVRANEKVYFKSILLYV